ncbi:MAG: HAD-IA family hydrolase [Bryobacteraceae bacterium]|nr:HAD-IA family hydrolase [Bryobacteraceae bacterium]
MVIFDLDGTLIDSEADLASSVNATLHFMGRDPLPASQVASYVGNGAPVLMRRALGAEASEPDVARALDYFIRYYHQHCLDQTTLYPGTREMLDALHAADRRLAILTNKPVRISHRIVEGLGLKEHFFEVYGGNSFEQKKPHPIGIERLLETTGLPQALTLMVGDSGVDVETARNAGVAACGVTFGLSPGTVRAASPDYLIDAMPELTPIVLA